MFNLFNHPNFALPSASVWQVTTGQAAATPAGQIGSSALLAPNATAGVISGVVNNSRQIQFAIKLIF
jgi:hypothetical protein